LKRSAFIVPPVKKNLKKRREDLAADFKVLNESTSDFPTYKDWVGSVRGLFMLYDTYDFDLDEANKGNIVYTVRLGYQ
jgi:hypothetical protein